MSNLVTVTESDLWEKIVQLRVDSSLKERFEAAAFFRKILSSSKENPTLNLWNFIGKSGLVKGLIHCLTEWKYPQLQLDACWALTNIVCGDEKVTHVVVGAGAVDQLCVLSSQEFNQELRDQAIWALSNIAGDCRNCRSTLLDSRFLHHLLHTLESETCRTLTGEPGRTSTGIDSMRTAVWALSNMCRGNPKVPLSRMKRFLPILLSIIQSTAQNPRDTEMLVDACWCVAHLADGTQMEIAQLVGGNPGLCECLVSFLYDDNLRLVSGALRSVGNIVTGHDAETQVVVESGLIPALLHLIKQKRKESLQREAVWTLSNVTAGTVHQIQVVLDNEELLSQVIGFLVKGDKKTQKEAIWAICNAATGGSVIQARRLVDFGVLQGLCLALEHNQADERSIHTILCAVEACLCGLEVERRDVFLSVLERMGMKNLLQNIKTSQDPTPVEEKAASIYDTYFSASQTPRITSHTSSDAESFVEFRFYPRKAS